MKMEAKDNGTTPVCCPKAAAKSISGLRPNNQKWTPRRSVIRSPSSSSSKSVFLHKWWLVKVNGKDLAVGGFTQRDQRVSLFCSAAIVKRQDATNLDTADGMTIILSGLIDQPRANENGFGNEVCHRFMLGFPLDWEKYCNPNTSVDPSTAFTSDEHNLRSGVFPNDLSSISLDDVPVAKIRDLMFGLGDSDNGKLMRNVCIDMMKKLDKTPQWADETQTKCKSSSTVQKSGENVEDCSNIDGEVKEGLRRSNKKSKAASHGIDITPQWADGTQTKHKSSSTVQKSGENVEDCSNVDVEVKEGLRRSNKKCKAASHGIDIVPRRGVSTRSMTRLKNVRNEEEPSQFTSVPTVEKSR